MKKILVLITFLLLLTGCTSSNIKKIEYKELNNMLEAKESFILYFGDDDNLKNTLENVLIGNNLTAYKLDVKSLNQEEINTLKLSIDYQEPSIVFIIDGKDPSIISHITDTNITKQEIKQRLLDMKFIK